MSPRAYRLGRRRHTVDQTRVAILAAARDLVRELGPDSSLGKVAHRAGVSRLTVYNQFGSKAGLLKALAPESRLTLAGRPAEPDPDVRAQLRLRIEQACATWAADPALYRRLREHHAWSGEDSELDRELAEGLAAGDHLRPGCSITEAQDVIGILTSFLAFDRLHKSGRRSSAAVTEILMNMAASVMVPHGPSG